MAESLVVLSHGLGGVPAGMRVFGDALRAALGARAVVVEARANASPLGWLGAQVVTADGVEAGGMRLAEEIVQLLDEHPSLTTLSLVGLSLGGLYARHAVGTLLFFAEHGWPPARTPDGCAECRCCEGEATVVVGGAGSRAAALRFRDGRLVRLQALVTLATPHVGVRGHLIPLYEFGVTALGVGGRSARQTMLADAGGALVDLADPDSFFGRALAMFAERWVVSNMDTDDKVPHWSSGLSPPTPGLFEAVVASEGGDGEERALEALRLCRGLVRDETTAWMKVARTLQPAETLAELHAIGLLSDEAHASLRAALQPMGSSAKPPPSEASGAGAGSLLVAAEAAAEGLGREESEDREEDTGEEREELEERRERQQERNAAAVACAESCCCATLCPARTDRRARLGAPRPLEPLPSDGADALAQTLRERRFPLRLVRRPGDRRLFPHVFSVFESVPADGASWLRAMEGAWWPGAHASRFVGVQHPVMHKARLLRSRLLASGPDPAAATATVAAAAAAAGDTADDDTADDDTADSIVPEAVLCAALRSIAPWHTVHVSFAHGDHWREFLCNHHRIAGGPPFPRTLLECLDEWPRRGGDVVRFLLHCVHF